MTAQQEVLVVESSTAVSNILKSLIFQAYGFNVEVAHNLIALRTLLRRKPGRFFAAIVDSQLPNAEQCEAIDLTLIAGIPTLAFVPNQTCLHDRDLWDKGIADYAYKSGAHSLEHMVWSVNRIFLNRDLGVLIAGSDAPELEAASDRLKRVGMQVFYCDNSDEAMYTLHQHSQIKIILLDCTQALIDGFELLNELRETHGKNDLEIIAIADDSSLSGTLLKSGANHVITLPFPPEVLLNEVNKAAERMVCRQQIKQLHQDKTKLITRTAFDVRSPLAAIKAAASVLKNEDVSKKRQQSLITMINDNCSNMLNVIDSVMDNNSFTTSGFQLELEGLDLSKIVQERVNLHQFEADTKQLKIQLDTHPRTQIQGDKLKLKQIVDILISNAIHAAPENSVVEISTALSQDYAFFRIIDSGPEIPRQEINDLFKTFDSQSSKPERSDLIALRKLVEVHDGSIYYSRNKRDLSVFSVEFPITA